MGCVLKAEGTNFMVDAFLEQSALTATARVFRRGEPEFPHTQPMEEFGSRLGWLSESVTEVLIILKN